MSDKMLTDTEGNTVAATEAFFGRELYAYRDIVLANGAFPRHALPLGMLKKARHIVCCDGAVEKLAAAGCKPAAVVGDCDSQTTADMDKWHTLLHIDKSEEYNDLQKALKYCLSQNCRKAALIGCNGLRDDHFIANLSIMADYSAVMDLVMVTDYGIFNVIRRTTAFAAKPGTQVSVFTTCRSLPLTFRGLKYPVERRTFSRLWEGSLNEALADSFQIILHGEGNVLVYRTI